MKNSRSTPSSEPIKAGDLVWVARGHECGLTQGIGTVFTVEYLEAAYSFGCSYCGVSMSDGRMLAFGRRSGKKAGFAPVSWLKRIPPLGELEGEKRDEEITA